jgi:hypothetical protein
VAVADLGVVYLYRFAEGEAAVRSFLDSYRLHPAGSEHDLHVIFKGFPDQRSLAAARSLFGALPVNVLELEDTGYDIGAYIAAAKMVSNRRLIFLNTFSRILARNWLTNFDNAMKRPEVGLVGATASWQANSSSYEAAINRILYRLRHPADYMKERYARSREIASQDVFSKNVDDGAGLIRIIGNVCNLLRIDIYLFNLYEYGRFPNPHIRTNAFMIKRDILLSLHFGHFRTKFDAYKFESGRRSLTKQILAQGLKPIVIDRWGGVYDIPEWRSSSTFWINDQTNLIVADNQTAAYSEGSPRFRKRLENYAWNHPWSWEIGECRFSGSRSR